MADFNQDEHKKWIGWIQSLKLDKIKNNNHEHLKAEFIKYSYDIMKNQLLLSCKCRERLKPVTCPLKKNILCATKVLSLFIQILNNFPLSAIDDEIFSICMELIKKLISFYYEVDELGCKSSVKMWHIIGRLIFDVGIKTESKYPGELEELYEVFCKEIVRYDGSKREINDFGVESPLATALYRLCQSNFNREKYRQTMSFAAFSALLATTEIRKSKAYSLWVDIKLKLSDSEDIKEITLLECLRTDTEVIKKFGIDVNINDYNLKDVCLTELKFLSRGTGNLIISMKKTLAELETMDTNLHFAQGIFLLCCHVLQLQERENISDYIKKAIHKLKSSKSKTLTSQCLIANLQFYKVVEKLYLRSQAIVKQIDDPKFTVKTFKLSNSEEYDNDVEEMDGAFPTCEGINIAEDIQCAKDLFEVLKLWDNCLQNMNTLTKDWEPQLTLETIVICGEYCRLFKFKNIEEKAWQLAYKLATALQDYTTCIYVTSRSISLRSINDVWITESEKYVERIKNSSKYMELDVVAIFWLSLADFYIDCKRVDEARELIEKVKLLQNYGIFKNSKVYLYSSDIQFRNYYALNEKTSQENYCQFLVEIHYALINLYDGILRRKFWTFKNVKYKLFRYEQIFESVCNIIVPMNSLLSFRQVSYHLLESTKFSQTLGITVRIGQFLKYKCYIALLHLQLNSCEITLEDLEHILCLESFQKSMKSECREDPNLQPTEVPSSSALKRKNFTPPDFLEHSASCECFACASLPYQSLCFSCAHLRAQLYSLSRYTDEAEQYFYGACQIKTRLEEIHSAKGRQYTRYKWRCQQRYVVDVILYMLDFSSFISDYYPEEKEDALALIEETREIAQKNDMEKHCVAAFTAELYFQHHFYQLKDLKVLKDNSVPNDIPITITQQPEVTPQQQIKNSCPNLRRRKLSPPQAVPAKRAKRASQANEVGSPATEKPAPRRCARNVRRKILVDERREDSEEPPLRRSKRLAEKQLK